MEMPVSLSWPVMEYKDRIVSIDTKDTHSVIMYVPYQSFRMFYDSETKEQR